MKLPCFSQRSQTNNRIEIKRRRRKRRRRRKGRRRRRRKEGRERGGGGGKGERKEWGRGEERGEGGNRGGEEGSSGHSGREREGERKEVKIKTALKRKFHQIQRKKMKLLLAEITSHPPFPKLLRK